MEQREWVRHDDCEMQFTVRLSSRNRSWSGIEAVLYDATAGFSEERIPNNSVSMHVGAPVFAKSGCDGASVLGLQRPGDIKIVPAGYTRIWETESPTQKLTMNVRPSLLRDAAAAMGVERDYIAITPALHIHDARIEHIGWALKAELESDDPLGRLFAESLGLSLASHLLRLYAPEARLRVAGGLPRRRLARVVEYVREHFDRDLSLGELADLASMSPSHFKVLFKQSTGMPVHQFVIQTRVERAVELITAGTLPLSDIALEAGFANQSHMARCVRRLTGTTPAVLRRESLR